MNKPTHDPELRDRARYLVVNAGLTLAEAGERTGIPAGTIKRWAASEGWVEKRERILKYTESIPEFAAELLAEARADKKNVEQINVWTRVHNLIPKDSGGRAVRREVVMDALSDFVEFVLQRDPKPEFREQLNTFMAEFFAGLAE